MISLLASFQWYRKLRKKKWYLVDNECHHFSYWTTKKPGDRDWCCYVREVEDYSK